MKRILLVLVLDKFDMRGCVIKVGNKINEKISCLVELMCKITMNVPALEGRARLISPREFQLLVIMNWQSSQNGYAAIVHVIVSPLIYDDVRPPCSHNPVQMDWESPQIQLPCSSYTACL